MPAHHVLAIDLGGTQLRAAMVDGQGAVVGRTRIPTPADQGPDAVIAAMLAEITRLRSDAVDGEASGIGVAAPGPLDPSSGIVYEVPNMPGWRDYPLARHLAEATGLPVWVHNDANLAALAEARLGAGQGFDPLIYITVSTGVGGGVVLGGEMLTGRHGLAGELGHMIVRAGGPACGLGHSGCLEALASGTAIARRARALVVAGQAGGIARGAAPVQPVTAATVARAARSGDSAAIELYHEAGEALGLALGSLINIFDPGRIVIGGGVSQAWDLFAEAMEAAVRHVAMVWEARPIDIVPAALGDDAGLVGAGLYALERSREVSDD